MKTDESFNFERFKEEAIQGLYEGRKMGGTDGVFAPMLKHLLESMLEGELTWKKARLPVRITVKMARQKRQFEVFNQGI